MKRLILLITILSISSITAVTREYEVYGPQGGLAMKVTLPKNFDTETQKCPMVILMHGIFSSNDIVPIPALARELAKKGVASISFDFGGHWKSEGEMQYMTIGKEIEDAMAMWEYARSLPYVTKLGLLGHSQGGVVASMTAGRISSMSPAGCPAGLVLIAPASVLKNACLNGKLLGAEFDPVNLPEYTKCFGIMKVGKEYLQSTQKLDIYGTAEAYKGPVRIIHGEKDSLVPLWCSEDYRKIYGENAELIVVEGENHRISRKTRKVAEMVALFFANLLG